MATTVAAAGAVNGDKSTFNILKYLFEVNHAKFVKRSGWWVVGIKDPESIAEHSFATAILAYVIASREKVENPDRIALHALFHDLHETRLLDQHKIASKYFKIPKEVKKKAERDQCDLLGKPAGDVVYNLLADETAILKDADYLEAAITARCYYDNGHTGAFDWIERVSAVLKTKTARELCELLKTTDSSVWWQGLKEDLDSLKY
ncbi:MAG: HD domain-containing protein [Candidatus Micrarchaeota archaeon]